MLKPPRDLADGAHPLAQPVEHTPYARKILGPDKLLLPQQTVLFDTPRARSGTGPSGRANCLRQAKAYVAGPSERSTDNLVRRGSPATIAGGRKELFDPGADHALISPATTTLESIVDVLATLAPAVTEVSR
ncbi:hypothetical protein [Amycolatopsis benzoatilytica]|uniref:hypothetical protein n=1 Tax=Amycolatopsis benzoatilytica TaxID=346045 RepID=UPI000370F7E9|nr:hypothetical protein [Amycolatopsis benzoatilytica]